MNKFIETKIKFENKKTAYCVVNNNKIYIKPKFFNNALHDDLVLLKIKDNKYGFVQKVILRNESPSIGQVNINDKGCFIKPWSNIYYKDFFVNRTDLNGAQDGDAIEFKFKSWYKNNLPDATIKKVLYNSSSNHYLLHKLNIPKKFPDNVLSETLDLKLKYDYDKRIDLTNLKMFSLCNSKCIQKLYSIEEMSYGYRIGFHISDVTHFIKVGSSIDQEAFKRGFDINLTENLKVSILPSNITEDLISFIPNVDRLAITVYINFDRDFNYLTNSIFRSIVKSNKNLDNKSINICLESNNTDYNKELNILKKTSDSLIELHLPNMLKDDITEVELLKSNLDKVLDITVTKFVEQQGYNWLYKSQLPIDESKVNELKKEVDQLKIIWSDDLSLRDNIFKLYDTPLKKSIKKKLKGEYYSAIQNEHFELGTNHYGSISNPVSDYSDIINHRILINIINEKRVIIGDLNKDSNILTKKRKNVKYCESYANKLSNVNFIKSVKDVISAEILYCTKKGIYVNTEYNISGWVDMKDYKWNNNIRVFKTDKEYKIGDSIIVNFDKIDWDNLDIFFKIK